MLILFDHVTPQGIAKSLRGHTVIKARDRGWDTLSNGELLLAAEKAGFDVVVTADKNMRYQQNLEGRKIALVVLGTPQMADREIAPSKDCSCNRSSERRQLRRGRVVGAAVKAAC